jgi:hypothetical protein
MKARLSIPLSINLKKKKTKYNNFYFILNLSLF